MAQSLPPGGLDLLEYAIRTSLTLELGFRELERYGRLMSDRAAARVAYRDDTLVLTLGRENVAPMLRQRAEFSIALALRLAREATATQLCPVELHFAHRAGTISSSIARSSARPSASSRRPTGCWSRAPTRRGRSAGPTPRSRVSCGGGWTGCSPPLLPKATGRRRRCDVS